MLAWVLVAAVVACLVAWLARTRPHLARTRGGLALVMDRTWYDGRRVRLLVVGGGAQSAVYLDRSHPESPFAYLRCLDLVFSRGAAAGRPVRRAALLGGGACAWPRQALAAHPEASIVVAEADAAVVALARRWFGLGELERAAGGRLDVRTCGARELLEAEVAAGRTFDAVANDCFSGRVADAYLWSAEGLALVRSALVPGGTYVANVACGDDVRLLEECCRRAAEAFSHVWVATCDVEGLPEDGNYLLVASDDPTAPEGGLRFEG